MPGILVRLLQFIIGFIGIGLVVFIHELGHFLAARALGVQVETFGIGMGPAIHTWHGRKTKYRLSLIPFGGYCQMEGSIDLVKALRDDERSFSKGEAGSYFTTTPLVRIIIFTCGPLVNFILALLLFFIVSQVPVMTVVHEPRIVLVEDHPALFGSTITQDELQSGDRLLAVDGQPVTTWEEAESAIAGAGKAALPMRVERDGDILEVEAQGVQDGSSWRYGISMWQDPVIGRSDDPRFREGDKILAVNGRQVDEIYDFYEEAGTDMEIVLLRDGEEVDVRLDPTTSFPFAWQGLLVPVERGGLFKSMAYALSRTVDAVSDTMGVILNMVNLDMEAIRNEVTGPTRAAQAIGSITTTAFHEDTLSGLRAMLYLLALVSISLCVANLIPIPTFDGGQIVINIWQLVTRRELGPRSYVVFQIAGIVCTVVILVAMYSLDVLHYIRLWS